MHWRTLILWLTVAIVFMTVGCGSGRDKEETRRQLEAKETELKSLQTRNEELTRALEKKESDFAAVNESLALVVKERDACQTKAEGESSDGGKKDCAAVKSELEKVNQKYKRAVEEHNLFERRLKDAGMSTR